MKILFSCVGTSDPIRGYRDGPMLHIVRHYLPEEIVLFVSAEMNKYDAKDNRYQLAIDSICQQVPNYHPVVRRVGGIVGGIEDVSEFDAFYEPFEQEVRAISEKYPDAEILLNLSSGSPQMKTTLAMITMDLRYRTAGIQVTIHGKQSGKAPRTNDPKYDVVTEIECNEDSQPGEENRCREPELFLIRRQAEREQIKALLHTYQYSALAEMRSSLPPSCRALVRHLALRAAYRTKEAEEQADKLKKQVPFALYPMKKTDNDRQARVYREMTEFYLCLSLMQKTGQLANFLVRMNPLIIRIQEEYLRTIYNFYMRDITEKKNGRLSITRGRVHAYSTELETYLDEKLNIMRAESDVSIRMCNCLIQYCAGEETADTKTFELLENVNNTLRNQMAHNLDNVTEDDLQRVAGCTSDQLLQKLENLIWTIFPKTCSKDTFTIYDRCNDWILQQL